MAREQITAKDLIRMLRGIPPKTLITMMNDPEGNQKYTCEGVTDSGVLWPLSHIEDD